MEALIAYNAWAACFTVSIRNQTIALCIDTSFREMCHYALHLLKPYAFLLPMYVTTLQAYRKMNRIYVNR